jgi:hypothetical protein
MGIEYVPPAAPPKNRNYVISWRVAGWLHGVRIRKSFKTREEALLRTENHNALFNRILGSIAIGSAQGLHLWDCRHKPESGAAAALAVVLVQSFESGFDTFHRK